jgi:uncharacterized protein (UPF0147 family)
MPERQKKAGSRSVRGRLDARKAKINVLKGIEKDYQCPRNNKRRAQGHREEFSMP